MTNLTPDELAAQTSEPLQPIITPDELGGIAAPGGPTLERLWQLSNYDPFFYRGLVAEAGYVQQAWLAQGAPIPIKPYIPPRPVPAYVGLQSSVGFFEAELAPDFGATAPPTGFSGQ